MELTKKDWEQVLRQSENMLRDAQLSEIASTLMMNRAKMELAQIEDVDKISQGEKEGVQAGEGAQE